MDCIFCKITGGDIPAKKIFEDDRAIAFHDVNGQAPTHFLVIPKQHIQSLADVPPEQEGLLGHLIATAAHVAAKENLEDGYRVVINTREDGGQTVPHLHIHVLGGRKMDWPPG
jgi:histidine triad (HIT) family protein